MVWIKRSALLVGGLAVILLLALGGAYGFSTLGLRKAYDITISPVLVGDDPATIDRGRHVAMAIANCGDCHGDDLGGKVVVDNPAIGRLVAPNLTPGRGGIGEDYTDADFVRAVRHGVGRGGRALLIMPSQEYYYLSDADLGALIAYLGTLPAVDRELPESRVGPLARALHAFGQLDLIPAELIDHHGPRPDAVAPGATARYGEYLAVTGGCTGCHGTGLSGGPIPGMPPGSPAATNITPAGIGSWTEVDFFRALRQGLRPDGSTIDPVMPWTATRQMTDTEIQALWLYLQSVPPREAGRR